VWSLIQCPQSHVRRGRRGAGSGRRDVEDCAEGRGKGKGDMLPHLHAHTHTQRKWRRRLGTSGHTEEGGAMGKVARYSRTHRGRWGHGDGD
jgi:hypothetical protein